MNTAELILAMRTRACMTQAELAKAIGVNPSTVCTLESPERRRRNTTSQTIMKIADACGVTIFYSGAGLSVLADGWGILPADWRKQA